jgi:hypothetical protein
MAKHHNPRIVTDGLVLCLDAANKRSYPGSGAVWTDLSKNLNLNIINSVFDNGNNSFFFDNPTNQISISAQQYAQSAHDTNYSLNLNGCSAFISFKNTSFLNENLESWKRQTVYSWGSDASLGSWHFERFVNSPTYVFRYKFDQEPTFGSTINISSVDLNEWCQLGFVLKFPNIFLYKNSILVNTLNISSKTLSGLHNLATLGVGAATRTDVRYYGFIGYIQQANFYSKSLTDQEIRQNFNATKSRYGI